jgi:hypothetical protein
MTDPADMIVPLLREMRAENLAEHERTRALILALDGRLDLAIKVRELKRRK